MFRQKTRRFRHLREGRRLWFRPQPASDANLHRYDDLSILLVGGGVNGIKGGQHIKYPLRTPLTSLLLTMLDKAGVPNVDQIGDSKGKLELVARIPGSADTATQRKASL